MAEVDILKKTVTLGGSTANAPSFPTATSMTRQTAAVLVNFEIENKNNLWSLMVDHVNHPSLGVIEINGVRVLGTRDQQGLYYGVFEAQDNYMIFFTGRQTSYFYVQMIQGYETGFGCDASSLFFARAGSNESKASAFSFSQCGISGGMTRVGLLNHKNAEV